MLSWFNKIFSNLTKPFTNNKVNVSNKQYELLKPVANTDFKVYLNDPTTPNLMDTVSLPVWRNFWPKTQFEGYQAGKEIKLDTLQWQAAQAMWFISQALQAMQVGTGNNEWPLDRSNWSTGKPVVVRPRAGRDFNAFYDRKTLSFFFDNDGSNIVYTVESLDIVSHETGHAILDMFRPDLFNTQALEVWAYHEAFADIVAILTSLNIPSVVEAVRKETNGDITKSNVVSRVGEELGLALYHLTKGRDGRAPGYLRNAVNNFKYTTPEKLPQQTLDNQLAAEPHSFARVFVGAFYDILAGMVNKNLVSGMSFDDSINKSKNDAVKLIVRGTMMAPASPRFYDAVARSILAIDRQFASEYQDIIKNVFTSRNILNNKQVKMLGVKSLENVESLSYSNPEPNGADVNTLVRLKNTKTIKLSDHFGVKAQSDNPLYNCEIEVPCEEYMEMAPGSSHMVDSIGHSQKLVINSARECIRFIHQHDLVEINESTGNKPFKIENNKLIRNYFI